MNYRTIRVSAHVETRSKLLLGVLVASLSLTSPTQAAAQAGFTAASVRANEKGNAGGEGSDREKISTSPTSITMQNVSLRSCLRWAYGVRDSQIAGPGWLATRRYDIAANTSGPASADELKQMTRKLLADRLKLQLHRESKELPVYAMVGNKKTAKMQPAAGGAATMMPTGGALVFRNYSMEALAERLAERPFKLDRQVIDKTGVSGLFDFTLKLAENETDLKHTLEGMERGSADQGPSMFTILQEQLGLSFKSQRAAIESLVIDHAEKDPTAN